MTSRELTAIFAIVASVAIAFTALFIPPPGELHESVLLFVAQLILYAGSIYGIGEVLSKTRREK